LLAAKKSLLNGAALAVVITAALLGGANAGFAGSPDPAYDWSGWWAGANIGGAFGSSHVDIAPESPGADIRAGFVSPRLNDSPFGALGGFEAGVDRQAGQIVYGVVTDFAFADVRSHVVGPYLETPFDFQTTDGQTLDNLGTLRARLGFTPWDRSLIYLTGGLAYGRASVSTFAIDTSADICGGTIKFCIGGNSQRWMAGFTLGAGWQYALGPNWSVEFEYLYYDLGKVTNSMVDILTPPDVFQGSAAVQGDIARLGLIYRFQ
jgi:outer membrane immunogenic protein